MAFPWDAAAGIGGSLISSAGSLFGQSNAARQAFKYQKRIMQNQVRWRVGDLERAGINPILAANMGLGTGGGGGGVSTPGFPQVGNPATSALAVKTAREQLKQLRADTGLKRGLTHVAGQTEMLTDAKKKGVAIENEILKMGIPAARAAFDFDSTATGVKLRKVRRVVDALSPFIPRTGVGVNVNRRW